MDKVNQLLAVVKKHYFWVGSGAIVVVALISWAQATSNLAKQYQDRKKAIDSHFTNMWKVTGQPAFPNDKVIEDINARTAALKGNVFQAWDKLYKEQKAKNRLPDGLSEEFKKYFGSLGPKDELPPYLLEHYQYFVKDHFPKLFDWIGARREKSEEGTGAGADKGTAKPARGGPGGTVEMTGVVDWDDKEQLVKRFNWVSQPTTLQVRLAQEDLWVYEAALRIIKNINGDVARQDQAHIKRIEFLNIGLDAAKAWHESQERVFKSGEAGKQGAGGVPSAGPGGFGTMKGPGAETGLAGRYVDAEGKPLAADAKPPYAEFNMMPIRMRLFMDQRQVATLLVECANSNMPIEVRALRLQPDVSDPVDLAALAATTDAGGTGPGPGSFGAKRPASKTPGKSGRRSADDKEGESYDLTVELQGIIYIFNPPSKEEIGTGSASQEKPEKVEPATAPAEKPTAKPPAEPAKAPEPGPAPPATPSPPVDDARATPAGG